MRTDSIVTIQLGRREFVVAMSLFIFVLILVLTPSRTEGQNAQDSYKDKFNIADKTGGIGVATSNDGKYVYVAGPQGILVSDDFGKVGSWVQTVKVK